MNFDANILAGRFAIARGQFVTNQLSESDYCINPLLRRTSSLLFNQRWAQDVVGGKFEQTNLVVYRQSVLALPNSTIPGNSRFRTTAGFRL